MEYFLTLPDSAFKMQEVINIPYSREADKETSLVLQKLLKNKGKHLIILLITALLSFFAFKFILLSYSSTATFYVNDLSILSSNTMDVRSIENMSNEDNLNRLFQLAHSSRLHEHLIKTFSLIKHYGVDTTQEFYFQKTLAAIQSRITVKRGPFNTIIITAKDKFRYMAADMANEIVRYIDLLNQDYFKRSLEKKIKISEQFISQLKKENETKSKTVDRLLQQMNSMVISNDLPTRMVLLQQQQKLSEILFALETSTRDLIQSQRLYSLAFQSINNNNFPGITIVQKGMAQHRSILYRTVGYTFLCIISVYTLIIFITYFRIRYHSYYTLIFSKNGKAGKLS
jgi:hypothetical protein